ncbi:magnesium transporter [Thiomicrorhabdus lithotrophica]|uniref:Magnesium transporter MgtE n=1 Tax=Thiomicrorhabdus lithotrophica TaxID=2949997 RepID=A0ABY8C978_9GAMM|nr:magnesium transporter [Thiomicrorhabdus lithotrophica]WEJ62529.1 magnesium transporter [Thiomicrorhabdus lithotrophica]
MSNDFFPEQISTTEEKLLFIQELVKEQKDQEVCTLFGGLSENELAHILESFPQEDRKQLWTCVPETLRGEVLATLKEDARQGLLIGIEVEELTEITKDLDAQDTAEILHSLNAEVEASVIESMDDSRREEVQNVLAYEEDAVGRYMHTDTISIRENVKLEVVQRYLRMKNEIHKGIQVLMVVDADNRLLGTLHIVDLIKCDPESLVSETMEVPETVLDSMSAIEAAKQIRAKNLSFAAVVTECGTLMGQLTADDVLELTLEESGQTVMNMAGLDEEEDLFSPIKASVNGRTIWLGINLATAFLAAAVIGQFEDVIAQVVALAVLMPVVASMGGIAGSQTLTLTIRGLSMGKIGGSNRRVLFNKEFWIGIINGLIWAVVVALISYLWFEDSMISVVIGLAILINMVAAAVSGVVVPLVLKKFGQDPALSGAVILTTVTDVVGFLSFLGLATLLILK